MSAGSGPYIFLNTSWLIRVLILRDYVQCPCKTRNKILLLTVSWQLFALLLFCHVELRVSSKVWNQPPRSVLDWIHCITEARPNNRAPHKLGMEITLGTRPVRGTVPRLNENCISGFPESVWRHPSLVTSVRRPCQARGPKSHFPSEYIICFKVKVSTLGFCECGDEPSRSVREELNRRQRGSDVAVCMWTFMFSTLDVFVRW